MHCPNPIRGKPYGGPLIIDLFCGCGGLTLAAHVAGLRNTVGIDIDANLSSSLTENIPDSKLLIADLSDLSPEDLKRTVSAKQPTAVVGGPPCQGFSAMGRRDTSDPRNQLLQVFFAYVAYFRPLFFLMENVPGLLNPVNRFHLDVALDRLPGRYRLLQPTIMDAADFGAATSRQRLVVIGYDTNHVDRFDVNDLNAARLENRASVREAISDLPKLTGAPIDNEWLPYPTRKKISRYAELMRKRPPRDLGSRTARSKWQLRMVSGCQTTRHSKRVIERFAELEPGGRDRISKFDKLSWDQTAYVLRAGTGPDRGSYQAARPIHPKEPRVITVREAARIQGFPDWFQFHPTKWHSHRMIGNSVSPIFAASIFKIIASKLEVRETMVAAE
jgi:DNA (cytosine-5)-methyltransferase 1